MRRSIYRLSILLVIRFPTYQAMTGIISNYMAMVLLMSHQLISWEVIGTQARLLVQTVLGDIRFWDGQVVLKDVDVNVGSSQLIGNWKSCNIVLVFPMLASLLSNAIAGRLSSMQREHTTMSMPSDLVNATRNDLR